MDVHEQIATAQEIARLKARLSELEAKLAHRPKPPREIDSEQLLRSLLAYTPASVAVIDRDGRFLLVNRGWEEALGFRREDAIGRTVEEILPGPQARQVRESMKWVLDTALPNVFEQEIALPGALRWHKVVQCPILASDGTVASVATVRFDVTGLKHAQEALQQRERHFRDLAEAVPSMLCTLDASGSVDYISSRWLAFTGMTREAALGYGWQAALHPEDRANLNTCSLDQMSEGYCEWLHRLRRYDGVYRWMLARAVPTLNEEGRVTGWSCAVTDVDDLKQAGQALNASHELGRILFETSLEGIVISTADGRIAEANPAICQMLGIAREDLIGRPVADVVAPEQHAELETHRGRIFGGSRETREWTLVRADGSRFAAEIAAGPLPDGRAVELIRDISARPAIDFPTRRWQLVFEQTKLGIVCSGRDKPVLEQVNAAFAGERGYAPEELIGKEPLSIIPPEYHAYVWQQTRLADTCGQATFEVEHQAKNGARIPVRVHLTSVRDRTGAFGRVAIVENLTEQKKIEEALRASEAQARALIENSMDAVFVAGPDGQYVQVNDAACRMLGYTREQLLTMRAEDVMFREQLPELQAVRSKIISGGSDRRQWILRRSDGKRIPVETSWFVLPDGRRVAFSRDVSEQQKAERTAQAILEVMEDGFLALDSEYRFTYVNSAVERDFGMPREQLLGRAYWEVHPHLIGTELDRNYRRVMETRELLMFEHQLGGRTFDIRIYPSPDGGVFAYGHDVTARKRLEQALRESEGRFREIADALPVQVWSVLPDGKLEFANNRVARYFGVPADAIEFAMLVARVHPEDAQADPLERRVATGQAFETEIRLRRADGAYRWFLMRVTPIRDSSGRILKWLGSASEIEDQKRTEEAFRSRTAELEALLEHAPIGFAFIGADHRYVRVNQVLAEIHGCPIGEHAGKTIREMVPGLAPKIEPIVDHVLASGKPLELEISGETAKEPGVQRHWLCGYYPVFGRAAAVEAVGAVVIDITDRKRMETALRRSNEDLEHFAFAASHDLQSPLRNVSMFAELLEREMGASLTEHQKDIIRVMRDSARRMMALVRALLEFARAGAEAIEPAKVDTGGVLATVLSDLNAEIEEARAAIRHDRLPAVMAQESHVAQLLQNLIGNAVRYRRPGVPLEVHVSARKVGRYWEFSIRDNGRGFKPEDAERIFAPFERAGGSDVPGTGIGLATCRRIVERYQGSISAESRPGEGSVFRFTLPAG
jgi:PAS domain S-box-containing protein